jgi:hypothetical protein
MSARLALALAVMTVLSLGCKKSVPDVDLSTAEPRVLLLTEQHDPSEVRGAIINAMQSRGWVAEGEGPANVVARLSHKGATIKVDMTYAGDRVTIKGLVAENAGKGYEKWVGNLEASIRDGLKKPEPVVVAPPPVVVKPAPTMAVFERKQQADGVKVAVQRALSQHSWVIESEDAAGLVARLNHRKGMVRVRIVYDVSQATISYVDSQDLNFDGGGRSDEYEKWMRNLVDSLRSNTR